MPDSPTRHEPEAGVNIDGRHRHTAYGLVLIAFVAAASAARWSQYPIGVDTYYHMAAIQGFDQAGGLPTWAFWELAPGGRPHFYPPALHAIGYLSGFCGAAPQSFITFLSWLLYPACLLTTWLWVRGIAGPRAALVTVIFLCGPGRFFWNQTAFSANALTMTLAPLALLALERERFLACSVLAVVATTAHPMGCFLPVALAVNALLRRKKLLAGLLVAAVPVALFAPWLVHMWANRSYLPSTRTGGALSMDGIYGKIELAMAVCAALAVFAIPARRRACLGLLGPLAGFIVILPMGFLERFLLYNIHWLLACLGGFGAATLLERLEQSGRLRPWVQPASVALAFLGLSISVSRGVQFPSLRAQPAPVLAGPGEGGPQEGVSKAQQSRGLTLRLAIRPSVLARILDLENQLSSVTSGAGPPDRTAAGEPSGSARPEGEDPQIRGDTQVEIVDLIRRPGAARFLEEVRARMELGQVLHVIDPVAASLVTGVTGRWATRGILIDAAAAKRPPARADCEFAAMAPGSFFFGQPPHPRAGGAREVASPPEGFERVFENSFGVLWKNSRPPAVSREPARAVVPLLSLASLAALGLMLGVADFLLGRERRRVRVALALGALLAAGICLAPLARTASHEILHPPPLPEAGARFPFRNRFPDVAVPRDLQDRHETIRAACLEHLLRGDEARWLWGPEEEGRFQRLLKEGNVAGAAALLDEGLGRLRAR